MDNKFLDINQVAKILDCSEGRVNELIESGDLNFYKIAGKFIRFKENEVLNLKQQILINSKENIESEEDYEYTFTEKLVDFLYFNDFYILALLIIFLILAIILIEVF